MEYPVRHQGALRRDDRGYQGKHTLPASLVRGRGRPRSQEQVGCEVEYAVPKPRYLSRSSAIGNHSPARDGGQPGYRLVVVCHPEPAEQLCQKSSENRDEGGC